MKIKEFIQNIAKQSKYYIEKYEDYKDLNGAQKKARVDDIIKEYIENTIDTVGLNFVVRFIIKKLIIENIPTITQIIFDLLSAKVKGITK